MKAGASRAWPRSDDRLIVHGILWGTAFVLGGKLASAAKEMVVAWRYGTSSAVDAYLFAFNLVTWPVAVWFAALASVLVPLAARLQHSDGAALARFRSELLALALLLAPSIGLLCWLGLAWAAGSAWVALPRATAASVGAIAAPMAALATLGTVSCLLSAWMQAQRRHANTLLEGVPALAIALAVLATPVAGINALVWGTLAGFALQLSALVLALGRTHDLEPPTWPLASVHWRAFRHGFGAMVASQALLALAAVLDQFFAARLEVGAVSTLAYANRLLALLLGIGVTVVARAALPVFSAAGRNEDAARSWSTTRRWTLIAFVAGLVGALGGWWLAGIGVEALFQRGAFTAQDSAAVTRVLQHGLLQLPCCFAAVVLQAHLSARGAYRAIAGISAVAIGAKAAACVWLVPSHGLLGLQWATAILFVVFGAGLLAVSLYRTGGR